MKQCFEHKVAILNICMGKLPASFPLFLEGVRNNRNFSFIIITDQYVSEIMDCPENLQFIYKDIDELRILFSDKLGFKVQLSSADKFYDYKPAYGFMFAEYLAGFTHWGYCDLNMVFGRLSVFLTGDLLNKYDKLLGRAHLSIYKNTADVNQAFLRSAKTNYKVIYQNPTYCMFDEWQGISAIFRENRLSVFHEDFAANIYSNSLNMICLNSCNHKRQLFIFNNGKVLQIWQNNGEICTKELAFFHVQTKNLRLKFDHSQSFPQALVLTTSGVYEFNTDALTSTRVTYKKVNGFYNTFSGLTSRIFSVFLPPKNRTVYELGWQ